MRYKTVNIYVHQELKSEVCYTWSNLSQPLIAVLATFDRCGNTPEY